MGNEHSGDSSGSGQQHQQPHSANSIKSSPHKSGQHQHHRSNSSQLQSQRAIDDIHVRPGNLRRAATIGPSTTGGTSSNQPTTAAAAIMISPPPASTTGGSSLHHTRQDSELSNSSDSSSDSNQRPAFKLPPSLQQQRDGKSSSVPPSVIPPNEPESDQQLSQSQQKRNQYLSIDFLPNNSNSSSSSPQSHPNSAPPSLIVSPLSALSSAASSNAGSTFGSNSNSLSLPLSSGQSSTSSSKNSSPKIASALRDHAFTQQQIQQNQLSPQRMQQQPHPSTPHRLPHQHHSFNKSPKSPSSSLFPHSPPPLHTSLSEPSSDDSEKRKPTVETGTVHTHYNAQGQKQINQYVIEGGEIGRGSYGTVKLVFNTEDQNYYAMKVMNKSLLKKRRVMGFSAGLARTASLGLTPRTPAAAGGTPGHRGSLIVPNGSPFGSPAPSPGGGLGSGSVTPGSASGPNDHWANVQREIAIMKRLCHPNIVRLYEVMDDPSTDNLYLIMEYMSHGAVMSGEIDKLVALPLDRCWAYFRDVVRGLEYIHFNSIVHRDLKPENLLLSGSGHVKISDFGVSMLFEGDDDRILTGSSTVGSAAFLAPELCGGGSGGNMDTPGNLQRIPSSIIATPIPVHTNALVAAPVDPTSVIDAIIASEQQQPQQSSSPAITVSSAASSSTTPSTFPNLSLQLPASSGPFISPFGGDGRSVSMPVSSSSSPSPSSPLDVHKPPLLRVESSHPEISGKKGDIWSLGVTLYVMVFGSLPFMAKTVALIYRAIVEDPIKIPSVNDFQANPNGVSMETHADLIDLLHRLLDKNPNTRINLHEIMTHPWVTKNGTEPMEAQCDYSGAAAAGQSSARPQKKLSISAQQRRVSRAEKLEQRRQSCTNAGLKAPEETEELTDTDTEIEEEDEEVSQVSENFSKNDNLTRESSTSTSYQPISLTHEDISSAVTLVSRVIMVVKLKAKMRKQREKLALRARSCSVGDDAISSPIARPKPTQPFTKEMQAELTALSPSTTPSLSNLDDRDDGSLSHRSTSSTSSKRHALGSGKTQALLKQVSEALTLGENASSSAIISHLKNDQDKSVHRNDSDSDTDGDGPSRGLLNANLAGTSPLHSSGDHRIPHFPLRKGSIRKPSLTETPTLSGDGSSIPPTPPPESATASRHQSAPIRPPPFYYIPYATYVQQPHSFSCSNLEDDPKDKLKRVASSVPGPTSHLNQESDSDSPDEDEEEVIQAMTQEQDLDI